MHSARFSVLTLSLLCACSDPAPAPAPAATPPAVSIGSAAGLTLERPAPEPPPFDPDAAGPAYFGVAGTGLVRVDRGIAKTLIKQEYPITNIVIDPRGIVYASAIGGTWSIVGDTVTSLPAVGDTVYHEHLAIGADGVLWTATSDGVHRWDRKAWTTVPKSTFGDILEDIAVDRAGRVWVATSDVLWRKDGETWTRLDTKFAKSKQPYFSTLVAGPAGEVWVRTSHDFFVHDGEGETWRKASMTPRDSILDMEVIAIGPDGRMSASQSLGTVGLVAPGAKPRYIEIKKTGAKVEDVKVQAVDGAGRTWLRSDNGVVILDADGKLLQQWLPGTVQGISGQIEAIAVAGKGPALPTLVTAARGIVVGKVVSKGKPVAGAAIELCTSPATIALFEKTPCTGSVVARTAVTGADGTFKVADVPIGSYGFAVKPKRTWFVTWGRDQCCTALEDGQVYDMGSITLDKLE